MKKVIDLNCDMGESFGAYKIGNDDEVIQQVTSVNIACGFHAGDPIVMDHTVRMAKEYGVGVGVHPGFKDLVGFGRRDMDVSRQEIMNDIIYQIGALNIFCEKHGVPLQHIKPHGNLNNMADHDVELATSIVDAVLAVKPNLPIFVKPGSQLHKVAKKKGLPFVKEVFADRAYNDDMTLVSRKIKGAVHTDPDVAANQAIKMVTEGKVTTITGREIDISGKTICVHGDTPSQLKLLRVLKQKLEEKGIIVSADAIK
jgi:UPF0271 protein